jgi:pimeloyl-ACP methyl ester carboxylesterase
MLPLTEDTGLAGLADGSVCTAAGIQTHYHEAGSGPPVVLLHGAGPGVSAWSNWRLVMPALARQFRVVAPDIVGFGTTARPPDVVYGVDTWARHVTAFLDELGISTASLVGNSMGGRVAMELAVRHPERVDRLVLMGSGGIKRPAPTQGLMMLRGYQPSLASMRELIRGYFLYDPAFLPDAAIEARYAASITPGTQEAFHAMFHDPRHTAADMSMPEELIATIAAPALIVHGREDKIVPFANSVRLLELIDDARLHAFGRCGHWTQLEKAAEFIAVVSGFLSAGTA